MSLQKTYDLILVGGGVIGLSIAWECAQHGLKVAVIDAGRVGSGSSWAGAGILPSGATIEPQDPLEQLRALSHQLHETWAVKLLEQTGIDNEYRKCGGLYLARSAGEKATLAANRVWWQEHGIPFQQVSQNEVEMLGFGRTGDEGASRNLQSDKRQFWWLPNDCRVRNPRHIKALLAACKASGVEVVEHNAVVDISRTSDWVVACKVGCYQASRVCLTVGAWTVQLLARLGIETGIMPVRGQMLLYKLDDKPFDCVVNEGHRYLVPRDDGHLLVGSCEEEVGFVAETTEFMLSELRGWAESIFPPLKDRSVIKSWAGLRPGSFDSYPYLGPIPSMPGLSIAAGHFRHGLHWSTGTALLMRQLICGEATSMELSPFHVYRKFGTLSV
ncbi:MAG: NAD(P)/FAD-dependent oxidoreductase [Pirellula sp.]|jgi:glycine oxidase